MAKTYIDGTSCKAVTGQFGEFFNMSFNIEKLQQYANEKGYVNITMSKRKEPGQYGDTHYFTLNDWKPEGGDNNYSNNTQTENKSTEAKPTG
jgi:hypothetical protein